LKVKASALPTDRLQQSKVIARKWSEKLKGKSNMNIGERLRSMRAEKKLSQKIIEERTGFLRCYISRVENGHTIPSVKTLQKFAEALQMPLYQLMYDGKNPPSADIPVTRNGEREWGSAGKDARFLRKLRQCLARMSEDDQEVLIEIAEKVSRRQSAKAAQNGHNPRVSTKRHRSGGEQNGAELNGAEA
jgi:transcriptional regulator with XRE-family HTH domain